MLRRVALLTRTTRRNIPEDSILHSHRRENLKSYKIVVLSANYCLASVRLVCVCAFVLMVV
jgi:hypothetical protein